MRLCINIFSLLLAASCALAFGAPSDITWWRQRSAVSFVQSSIVSQTNTSLPTISQRLPAFPIYANVPYLAVVAQVSGFVRDNNAFTNTDGIAWAKLGETNWNQSGGLYVSTLSCWTFKTNIDIASSEWGAGFDSGGTAPTALCAYALNMSNTISGAVVQSHFNNSGIIGFRTMTNSLNAMTSPQNLLLVFVTDLLFPFGQTNSSLPVVHTIGTNTPTLSLLFMSNTNHETTVSNFVLTSGNSAWAILGLEHN